MGGEWTGHWADVFIIVRNLLAVSCRRTSGQNTVERITDHS